MSAKATAIPQMTIDEFHAALKAQGVPREHLAFKCPACGTVQSAADLIAAGAGADFDSVERYLAFSCVGRFTGKGSAWNGNVKRPAGDGCNWTLGGLFQIHKLTVIADDGSAHARFEVATPEEAQEHAALAKAGAA